MEYVMYAVYGAGALAAFIVLYCCYKKCCTGKKKPKNKQRMWSAPSNKYGGPDLEMDNRSNYGMRPPAPPSTNRAAPPLPYGGNNAARQAPQVPNQYPPQRVGPPAPPPVPPIPSSNRFGAPGRPPV